jgi:hypothetical protein
MTRPGIWNLRSLGHWSKTPVSKGVKKIEKRGIFVPWPISELVDFLKRKRE